MEIWYPKKLCPKDYSQELVNQEKKVLTILLEKMENTILSLDEYSYLQYLLMKYEFLYWSNYKNSPPYPLCKTAITGEKILFVADSHRGNKKMENKQLIDFAYGEAARQNIKTAIHAGDFIEGCAADHNKRLETVYQELATAIDDLPNDITTKLLLGNHDYSAIRTYPEIIPYYFNFPKLEVLGMQKVLLNWDGQATIRVNHPISQLKYPEEEESDEVIIAEGHHHYYRFIEELRTINLVSLSSETTQKFDETLYDKGFRFFPLFVIAEKYEDYLLFRNYSINASLTGLLYPSETIEVNCKTKQIKLYK